MADLPQQNTINQYQADGVTLVYVYSYLILLNSDITVYVTPSGQTANPDADIQVLNVDYTVSGMGVPTGGFITFTVAPALGDIVTIVRTIQVSIDTNFSLAQNFNGGNLDDAFERVTLFTQQTATVLNTRALQYITNTYLPNENSNLVPPLPNGYVWSGLDGAIVATNIETDVDTSVLRSQLASESPLADGALLVGYYDTINNSGGTVSKYLDYQNVFGDDTGSADALVLTIPNSGFDYARGQTVRVLVANNNATTTPTININSKGAKLIKRNPTSAAQPGDLAAGAIVDLTYDGTQFCITNLFIPTVNALTPTVTILNAGAGLYTPPVGCTWFVVEGCAAGGGSGGSTGGGSNTCSAGAGGGGGGYFRKVVTIPLPSYPYVVGTGGAGGVAGNNAGVVGDNTTFGAAFLVAVGGAGGPGCANFTTGNIVAGAMGGVATGGDINITGGSGGPGISFAFAGSTGGFGGSSALGQGIAGATVNSASGVAGRVGLNYGGGASGAASYATSPSAAGARGADGVIIITEYYYG